MSKLGKQPQEINVNTQTGEIVVPQSTGTALTADAQNMFIDGELPVYYSLKSETEEEKIALYNALNNPTHRLADFINMEIKVKDICVEQVELENELTGEMQVAPRIIFIDEKGESYACVSIGVFSAVKKLIKIFGEPTWTTPRVLMVKQIKKGEKSILSIQAK